MGNISKFIGGGGTPVGGVVPLWGAGNNPTINGAEYLRSGVLKAISGYTALLTSNPTMCWNAGCTTKAATGIIATALRFTNGRYYAVRNASSTKTATSLSGPWGDVTGGPTSNTEAFVFGNNLVTLAANAATGYSINGIASTDLLLADSLYCGAVNSGATLGMICKSSAGTSGFIKTSTDGATFTARTPSGAGDGGQLIYAASWMPCANAFIYVGATGYAHTTTDGYTLTSRGVLGSFTAVAQSQAGVPASEFSASSATVTLLSVVGTYGGLTNQFKLVRTINGTSFTVLDWATLLGISVTAQPRVQFSNGIFIAICFAGRATDAQVCFQSTDGLTWTPLPVPMNPAAAVASTIVLFYINGEYVCLPDASNSDVVFTLANLNATHVGMPLASTNSTSGGTTYTNYVRIK